MAMTVQALIAALRKMPPRAKVVFCAHDQNDEVGEYDGFVTHVSEASSAMKKRGAGVVLR